MAGGRSLVAGGVSDVMTGGATGADDIPGVPGVPGPDVGATGALGPEAGGVALLGDTSDDVSVLVGGSVPLPVCAHAHAARAEPSTARPPR
jgi:hypothetical protein